MEMYRKFRGADPNKEPMLRSRGLLKDETAVEETLEVAETVMPHQPGKAPVAPLKPTIK
jgi:hypothetical protein